MRVRQGVNGRPALHVRPWTPSDPVVVILVPDGAVCAYLDHTVVLAVPPHLGVFCWEISTWLDDQLMPVSLLSFRVVLVGAPRCRIHA